MLAFQTKILQKSSCLKSSSRLTDCIVCHDSLKSKFKDNLQDLDVKDVFSEDNKRLSLDDARHYESLLKEELIRLKSEYPEDISDLLAEHKIDGYTITESNQPAPVCLKRSRIKSHAMYCVSTKYRIL